LRTSLQVETIHPERIGLEMELGGRLERYRMGEFERDLRQVL